MDHRIKHCFAVQLACVLVACAAWYVPPAMGAHFQDPRSTPATPVPGHASNAPLLGVARAGQRLVAVGLRGVIITSDDGGKTWQQQACPVSSDLVDVYFATLRDGWAVGFDGIVLSTDDGGTHWRKLLDGRQSSRHMVEYYKKVVAAGETSMKHVLGLAKANYYEGSGSLPWLGVWFRNKAVGYVVGSFGNMMKTSDGGRHWQPWLDHVEDQSGLHLNDITEIGGDVYIAAERGVVLTFDPRAQVFLTHHTSYDGAFFGVTGDSKKVIAYGLDGHAFVSTDEGNSWSRIKTPGVEGSITAGVTLADGRVVLATSNGVVITSDGSSGWVFTRLSVKHRMMYTGLVEVKPGLLLAVGMGGVHLIHVRKLLKQQTN